MPCNDALRAEVWSDVQVFAITGGQFVACASDWALASVPGTWR